MNKVIFLLLLSLILLPLHESAFARLGDWIPIPDVKVPHIIEIGKFAVTEYNTQNKSGALKFVTVVRGEVQTVSGLNYRLVVAADRIAGGDGTSKNYKAIVLEIPWLQSLNLTSFEPLLENRSV